MSDNIVHSDPSLYKIIVVTDETNVNVTQGITKVIQVNTSGPQGPAGTGGGGATDISALNSFSASMLTFTGSIQTQVNSLTAATRSYATTGSNTFRGNQIITGSIIFNSGSQITSTYYGNNYPGYIDIVAGAPDGFVELLSYNQSSSVNVDDYSVYITTNSSSLFNLWEFKNNGILEAPGGIKAPSFTGSLFGTASFATTASFAQNVYAPVFITYTGGNQANGSTAFTDVHTASATMSITNAGFYEFEIYATYNSTATSVGMRYSISGSSSFSYFAAKVAYDTSGSDRSVYMFNSWDGGGVPSSSAATTGNTAYIYGHINATSTGSLFLRQSSEVGGQSVTTTNVTGYLRRLS